MAPHGHYSVASYRAWLAFRPERERWELIAGKPAILERPCRRHQRIASNLVSLLKRALERHDPRLGVYHGIGINLVSSAAYDVVPDVVVLCEDENPNERYADRFYLVGEVLSDCDKWTVEDKRGIYREQPSCMCILLVRQDRREITVERRVGSGWQVQVLHGADQLALPEFGLTCSVKDIYPDTSLG